MLPSMSSIKRLDIATQIPTEDRELAEELSNSPHTGDPDPKTLSNIEVTRAWQSLDLIGASRLPSLIRLSRRLGVVVPETHDPTPIDRVLGPAPKNRRTRIVSTVGPGCADVDTLAKMITAGMDIARLNFSHIASFEDAKGWVDTLEAAMTKAGRRIEIMADLRGPKIRVGDIKPMLLVEGDELTLGPKGSLPLSPATVAADLKKDERIFLDDGKIELKVTALGPPPKATVVQGGTLLKNKGLNLPDTALSETVPTEKDERDIETIAALGLTLIAVSFVEDGADLERVRTYFDKPVRLIAKIERKKAVDNIESIFAHSDGLMVARGDGAVEMGDEHIPVIQRKIHARGNKLLVPTGTATEMMDSMTDGGRPTRAEASDVARAALEGSDFVMTSAETAMGKDPAGVIKAMSKILEATERAIRTGTVESLS